MVRLQAVLFSQSSQGSAGLERTKWPRVYGCPVGGTCGMFNKPKKDIFEESDWIKINLIVSNREDTLTMLT